MFLKTRPSDQHDHCFFFPTLISLSSQKKNAPKAGAFLNFIFLLFNLIN